MYTRLYKENIHKGAKHFIDQEKVNEKQILELKNRNQHSALYSNSHIIKKSQQPIVKIHIFIHIKFKINHFLG